VSRDTVVETDSAGVYFCSVETFGGSQPVHRRDTSASTIATALEEFVRDGYAARLRTERVGIRDVDSGQLYAPESLQMDHVFRFEGDSDPADGSAVFALSDSCGRKLGTLTLSFGPQMEPSDGDCMGKIRDGRRKAAP